MPCISGRANHKLLRKDCLSGCNCYINTAYSCTPICCKEELFNNDKKPNIANFLCKVVKSIIESSDCEGPLELITSVEPFIFPGEIHCPVTLSATIGGCDAGFITWEDSTVIANENNVNTCIGSLGPGTFETIYFVDGVECHRCQMEI
jgi:hypothetical protein